jgi:hypothetical protein
MPLTRHLISTFAHFVFLVRHLVADFAGLAASWCRSQGALTAENLFLRKQLALFQERKVKPHRATNATRFMMFLLGRFFDWSSALVVVKPDSDPMASQRISPVLGLEVRAAGPAQAPCQTAGTHAGNGPG